MALLLGPANSMKRSRLQRHPELCILKVNGHVLCTRGNVVALQPHLYCKSHSFKLPTLAL